MNIFSWIKMKFPKLFFLQPGEIMFVSIDLKSTTIECTSWGGERVLFFKQIKEEEFLNLKQYCKIGAEWPFTRISIFYDNDWDKTKIPINWVANHENITPFFDDPKLIFTGSGEKGTFLISKSDELKINENKEVIKMLRELEIRINNPKGQLYFIEQQKEKYLSEINKIKNRYRRTKNI